ncbi:hypothetical protein Salat_0207600 [Sesamum alatum]|uniref:RNase H type-1 domain-containing protein n=1 Tax=Sesamum alatum TaxID=300844 RepID=A0AAE1YY16_9LAMI|nr:hypothetical protein Salat_0207600 [Sesamum alatum]
MTGSTAEDIVANSRHILWEFGEFSQSLQQLNMTASGCSYWKAPIEGVIKVNFDGATFAEWGAGGIGVIAHDYTSACVSRRMIPVNFKASSEHVELLAATAAVDLAREKEWLHVIVEGDCLSVINKLTTDGRDFSILGNLVEDIKKKASYFSSCQFSYIKREANSAAHRLARAANPRADASHTVL